MIERLVPVKLSVSIWVSLLASSNKHKNFTLIDDPLKDRDTISVALNILVNYIFKGVTLKQFEIIDLYGECGFTIIT